MTNKILTLFLHHEYFTQIDTLLSILDKVHKNSNLIQYA